MTTAVYDEPARRNHIVLNPPIDCTRTGRLGEDVRRITQVVTHELEHLVRAAGKRWGRAGSMHGLAPSRRSRNAKTDPPHSKLLVERVDAEDRSPGQGGVEAQASQRGDDEHTCDGSRGVPTAQVRRHRKHAQHILHHQPDDQPGDPARPDAQKQTVTQL